MQTVEKKQEQPPVVSSDDLRKNTREAVSALSSAISKLTDQITSVAETKNAETKQEMIRMLDTEKLRIDECLRRVTAADQNIVALKTNVKSEVVAELNNSVEESKTKMQQATQSAVQTISMFETKFAEHTKALSDKVEREIKMLKERLKDSLSNAANNI